MTRRWIGYAGWLLLAAILYFFENNTGTRAILLGSLLFPLIPPLRAAWLSPDKPEQPDRARPVSVRSFAAQTADEPGDLRVYRPGDPIRRIHWKLSARRGALLVRESLPVPEPADAQRAVRPPKGALRPAGRLIAAFALSLGLTLALLLLLPPARLGAQALCNRLFAASEAVNAYAYDRFPVPADQPVGLAAALTLIAAVLALGLVLITDRRPVYLALAAACVLLQVYFGLSLPEWANILCFAAIALRITLKARPGSRPLTLFAVLVSLTALMTFVALPGVEPATEAASEAVRDRLSQIVRQDSDGVQELAEGETEIRRTHPEALESGTNDAETGQTYRLITVSEAQISRPRWFSLLRTVLLLLMALALVTLPFAPFLLLNARRRRAREARRAFETAETAEAVLAIFRRVILWLTETGHDAEHRLYRDWPPALAAAVSDAYAADFAVCAADFEQAAYSGRALPEASRARALSLLQQTETLFWPRATFRQRLRIRYWLCLCD